MIDEAKLKKLPVWAKHEIQRLTSEASEWRKKALAATGGTEAKTEVVIICRSFVRPDDVLVVSGHGPITVMPAASNMVYVKPGWSSR